MSSKQVEIQFEDPNPQKWCQALKEEVFASLSSTENASIHKAGSLFSPLLFGKFFDPSDAFPLWEFESDELLPPSTHRTLDWHQTDHHFLLKADISGNGNGSVEVAVENGKILEISGQQKESKKKKWKNSWWWEHGYVRRIELGEQSDWRKTQAFLHNDAAAAAHLEIRIPKHTSSSSSSSSS